MAKFYARIVLGVTLLTMSMLILAVLAFMSESGGVSSDMRRIHVDAVHEKKSDSAPLHSGTTRKPLFKVNYNDQLKESYQNPDGDKLQWEESPHSDYVLVTDDNTTIGQASWRETTKTLAECSLIDYTKMPLADLSVVICFHGGENVSNLLHTMHSVYQRTPGHILREIILIDDNSHNDDFGQTLELYVETMFEHKVRIIRSRERLGLIRARLLGIQKARGEVVVIMDSHVEVQPRWSEPLLKEILHNPKTLASSYLDWMTRKGDTWEYVYGGSTWKSYFDWTFVFGWQMMSKTEKEARLSLTEAIETPVIIGTIYAIKKSFFEEVGAFDPGMQLWGGENLDLPIRVWLCGGRVVNVPCSRAGHLETHGHRDYRLTSEFVLAKYTNYKRFAEVWAGDYKKYFYMYDPASESVNAGDLSSRRQLKSRCPRDFGWFLKNIFPQLGMPDENSLAWGMLRNVWSDKCLDTRASLLPGVDVCGTGFNRQGVFWSDIFHLRFPIHVINNKELTNMGIDRRGLYLDEYISHYNMSIATEWFHWEGGPLMDIHREKCLEVSAGFAITFEKCNLKSPQQMWRFQHYNAKYYDLISGKISEKFSYRLAMMNNLLHKFQNHIPLPKHEVTRRFSGGDPIRGRDVIR